MKKKSQRGDPTPARSEEDPAESEQGVVDPRHSPGVVDELGGHHPFPVVGVGASAGGLEAFRRLLSSLPAETGMAFILVQHLDPHHESRLSDLLARATSMPVIEATDGLKVSPNHAYVIPPNANMALADGRLHITPRDGKRGPHLPVDYLFRSLASDQQARAIGVVLSGTGSDGTLGLSEIKAVGGITFAQDEKSATHNGMPHSALDSGCVDFVLGPEEIAIRLARIGEHPYLAPVPDAEGELADHGDQLKKILGVVRTVTGVDFSMYRDTTIKRRILRRMALHAQQSWSDYLKRLQGDRSEVDALYHDLLINVTSFFRDNEMFDALKVRVLPELVKNRLPSDPLRVWVPGCSTGQEAYSLAIALIEFFDDKPVRPQLQIFATDLSDQTALDRARAGVYPESIEAEVSPERLRRFFKREDHVYRIEKSIREMCVFARQNVAADPPFSHLDLISCRNVLIYLSPPLQKRILPTFHYALNVPGFLVLGSAETIGENSDLFDMVDRTNKIFVKKATAARLPMRYSTVGIKGADTSVPKRFVPPSLGPGEFQREADRLLLGRYSPPGVLVNENFDVVQFRGVTSAFLESPSGEPTTNVLKMAREGLFLELRSSLTEAQKTNQPVRRDGVRVRAGGRLLPEFSLEVVPLKPRGGAESCYLILFSEGPPPRKAATTESNEPVEERDHSRALVQLEQELSATKEYLQSLVEQQDAANEELRSANEEILSSNEELQSTNEELETAKEELQSSNEELTTVNEQLQHRNVELSQANNDLTNLMSSTNIPLVMVGGDLRIRRFTSPARKVMSLLPTDVGRPIGDIKPAILVPDLEAIIESVIETVQPQERVAQDRDGRWQSLRVYPYRTSDHRIDGAVIVLVDIDEQKRSEESLRQADRRKDEFLATLAHELRNPVAPIANAVEIMRLAGNDPAAVAQAREVLFRQVKSLSRIVEDLIDVSRIVAKKVELKRETVALTSVVDLAVESCLSQIEGRHQHLIVSLPNDPVFISADPVRLGQILVNLLNNATKFTDDGGQIWLSAEIRGDRTPRFSDDSRRPAPPRVPHLVVKVRDNGVGIPADLMPHVFDMFAQGERRAPARGGLGIGLSLVRALVQMHGGEIEAHSEGVDRGSEFIVRMPLSIDTPDEADETDDVGVSKPAPDRAGARKRILVVDDNEDQAQSLGMLMRVLGNETRLAFDGLSAVEAATSFVPDLALIDIGIPGINGYEVARRIREMPQLQKVVLVAQTGWGHDDDRARSRDAGFDYHLVKPLNLSELRQILAASGAPPAKQETARDDSPPRLESVQD